MDVQHGAPILIRHLVEEVVPRYAGVVDEDIQAPVAVYDLPDGPLDLGAARNVHFGCEGVHTLAHQLARRRERAFQVYVRKAHPRTLTGEAPRRGLADTARRPRHHRNSAVKTAQVRSFQSLSISACQHAPCRALVSISARTCAREG